MLGSRSERILLTGSGGFTGRPLAQRLRADGHHVTGMTRLPGEAGEHAGDLCDADWVKAVVRGVDPTVVIHLAGITTVQHANVSEIYSANVIGTVNLLTALSEHAARPRLTIVASSATVYAAGGGGKPIGEDAPLGPRTHYAASKRMVEDVARLYADRLPIVVTRPFNYTGPGQSTGFLVPKIVDHFVRRQPEIMLGNLDLFRDLSDIERVIEVYSRLVSGAIGPMTLNICSGRTVYLGDIISLMQEISGHDIKVVRNQALFRDNEERIIQGSAARLESMLGTLPNPEFELTLRRMYEAARQ